MKEIFSRREFIKGTGIGAAGVALAVCVGEERSPFSQSMEEGPFAGNITSENTLFLPKNELKRNISVDHKNNRLVVPFFFNSLSENISFESFSLVVRNSPIENKAGVSRVANFMTISGLKEDDVFYAPFDCEAVWQSAPGFRTLYLKTKNEEESGEFISVGVSVKAFEFMTSVPSRSADYWIFDEMQGLAKIPFGEPIFKLRSADNLPNLSCQVGVLVTKLTSGKPLEPEPTDLRLLWTKSGKAAVLK